MRRTFNNFEKLGVGCDIFGPQHPHHSLNIVDFITAPIGMVVAELA
jgi:hypothetical protein